MPNYLKLIISILLSLSAGALGGLATASSVGSWYATLEKPVFNPPSWLFGPVWTLLYIMMGIALFLIWRIKDAPGKKRAMMWFWIQLILNALWSPAFFGLESPLLGLVIIVPLWVAILMTIKAFYPINKLAGGLLIPYFLWVSFATILNASIWWLN